MGPFYGFNSYPSEPIFSTTNLSPSLLFLSLSEAPFFQWCASLAPSKLRESKKTLISNFADFCKYLDYCDFKNMELGREMAQLTLIQCELAGTHHYSFRPPSHTFLHVIDN